MNISIRQGETLSLNIKADDVTAQTVQMIVNSEDGVTIINQTAVFETVEGERLANITTSDTDYDVGVYRYMLTIVYEDDSIDKLPDPDLCEEEDGCELPTLTICESLSVGVS